VIALFLVLIVSLAIAGFFLSGFLWSVKNAQFEDKQGSAMRMLFDEEGDKVA
jgi:cbb3-type cytochrome oxidase maturation protein